MMDLAAGVYFRRLAVIGDERFPRRGAVLVVANHPAAWTDVVVLDVALRRKLHFVAHETLFRPWIRGLAMKLFAAMPLRFRHEGPASIELNRRTFDRGHALFRRGEVIAFFPEGVSGDDRNVGPLKTGAARLALEAWATCAEPPVLIPVAIYYEDRTAFRSRVDVAVGEPIPLEPTMDDPDDAAHALTRTMAQGLESALTAAAGHARTPTSDAGAPGPRDPARTLTSLVVAGGAAVNALPLIAIEGVARRFGNEPQRIAFTRILSGVVLLPLWYGALAALARALGGGAWYVVPLLAPVLGVVACRAIDRQRAAVAPLGRDGGPG